MWDVIYTKESNYTTYCGFASGKCFRLEEISLVLILQYFGLRSRGKAGCRGEVRLLSALRKCRGVLEVPGSAGRFADRHWSIQLKTNG